MSSKTYNPVSIIRKKRDGAKLSNSEITYLIDEYSNDRLPDYQMSAFLMAAFLNELDAEESSALTEAMLHSGTIVDLGGIPGKKVDKHSTGGVGDKLSLILAPVVASYGVPVPMISGRGLGHTGGTLDKLESISGFNVDMSLERYVEIIRKHNMVMAGQTEDIAPADKRLYSLRDVTATVESIPLIASSIMSKKLAEGIDALVLDVKFGSGAFMKTENDALELAETLVAIGEKFEKRTIAYLTGMEQPLGYKIGNRLEVEESLDALRGEGPADVMEVTHMLAGTMIWLGGKAGDIEEGVAKSREAVENGQALKKWRELVAEQGGDLSPLMEGDGNSGADHVFEFKAPGDGCLQETDAYEVGMASLELGAGRKRKNDAVDPDAGVVLRKKNGDYVEKGETIATCFTNNNRAISQARKHLERAFTIGTEQKEAAKLVKYRVDREGVTELKT